jgi:hypothetical protein
LRLSFEVKLMATVTAPQHPPLLFLQPPSGGSEPPVPTTDEGVRRSDWEFVGHLGDWVGFCIWIACVVLLALMILWDLAGLLG